MVLSLKFLVPTATSLLLCARLMPIVGANNVDGGYPITDDQIGKNYWVICALCGRVKILLLLHALVGALVNFADKCDYSRFPSYDNSICRPSTSYSFCWSWDNDPNDFFYLGYSSTQPPRLYVGTLLILLLYVRCA